MPEDKQPDWSHLNPRDQLNIAFFYRVLLLKDPKDYMKNGPEDCWVRKRLIVMTKEIKESQCKVKSYVKSAGYGFKAEIKATFSTSHWLIQDSLFDPEIIVMATQAKAGFWEYMVDVGGTPGSLLTSTGVFGNPGIDATVTMTIPFSWKDEAEEWARKFSEAVVDLELEDYLKALEEMANDPMNQRAIQPYILKFLLYQNKEKVDDGRD